MKHPCVLFIDPSEYQVCDFIERRDGHRADPNNIFLTNGASEAVRLVLRAAIRGKSDGVLVPVPQVRGRSSGAIFSAAICLWRIHICGLRVTTNCVLTISGGMDQP